MNTRKVIKKQIWEQISAEMLPLLTSTDPFERWGGHSFERYLMEPYPAEWFSIQVITAYRFCQQVLHIYLKCNGEVISFCEVSPTREGVLTGLEKFFYAMNPYWDNESLEKAWKCLADIPIDANERLEEPFLHFSAGTQKEDVWDWFDELYSEGGVYALLYPDGEAAEEAPELPDGPLFTDEERAFIRKFGASSEAEALIQAMEEYADALVQNPNSGIDTPVAPFAGIIYQMVHTMAKQANASRSIRKEVE